MTVPRIFEALVKKHPDRVCFIFEDTKWTFREVRLPSIPPFTIFFFRFFDIIIVYLQTVEILSFSFLFEGF